MKFSNLKIGTRLGMGFGVLCLFLVITTLGVTMLGRLNHSTDEIAN